MTCSRWKRTSGLPQTTSACSGASFGEHRPGQEGAEVFDLVERIGRPRSGFPATRDRAGRGDELERDPRQHVDLGTPCASSRPSLFLPSRKHQPRTRHHTPDAHPRRSKGRAAGRRRSPTPSRWRSAGSSIRAEEVFDTALVVGADSASEPRSAARAHGPRNGGRDLLDARALELTPEELKASESSCAAPPSSPCGRQSVRGPSSRARRGRQRLCSTTNTPRRSARMTARWKTGSISARPRLTRLPRYSAWEAGSARPRRQSLRHRRPSCAARGSCSRAA